MNKFTRGNGLLENFLSKRRSSIANGLIPKKLRNGRILDIGCGTNPFFLKNTKFNYKYGIDKLISNKITNKKFILKKFDIEKEKKINFKELPTKDKLLYYLAEKTDGYVGADIEAVCREAAMLALREDIKTKEVTCFRHSAIPFSASFFHPSMAALHSSKVG